MSAWTARARRAAIALAPPGQRLPAEFYVQRRVGKLDPVLARIDLERRVPGRAIDAGANTGAYTYAFSRVCAFVEAFEPQPSCAASLSDFARGRENVRVHRFGLSDRAATAMLHVPVVNGRWRPHLATGLASLTPHAVLPTRAVAIELVALDAFGFRDVAVIKIDVEGHERHVLEGARETIAANLPTIVLETEQRHLPADVPVDAIFGPLLELGYDGWFFRDGEPTAIAAFRVERDQVPFADAIARGEAAPGYINNFVFTHPGRRGRGLFDGAFEISTVR
jgi:FkbM family methyltransferase